MRRITGIPRLRIGAFVVVGMLAAGLVPAVAATTAVTQASARPAPASAVTVTVTYVDPETFSEVRQYGQQDRYNNFNYLTPLKSHLIKRATRMLPPGDRLEVNITDIQLAGGYEPWRGPTYRYVRFMKDLYPPRIDLAFKLIDSQGKVLREGSRKLRNVGYLSNGVTRVSNTDPLRYDKALLDRWLQTGPEKL